MLGAKSGFGARCLLRRSHCVTSALIACGWWLAFASRARFYAASGAWASCVDHRLCRCIDRLIRLRVDVWSSWVGLRRCRFCCCDTRLALKVPLFPSRARVDLCNSDRIGRHVDKRVGRWRVPLNNISHRQQHLEKHRRVGEWRQHATYRRVRLHGALRLFRCHRHRDAVFWRHGESSRTDSAALECARGGTWCVIRKHDGCCSAVCSPTRRNRHAAGSRNEHLVARERDKANSHLLTELLLRRG